jgi:hypothetical protein
VRVGAVRHQDVAVAHHPVGDVGVQVEGAPRSARPCRRSRARARALRPRDRASFSPMAPPRRSDRNTPSTGSAARSRVSSCCHHPRGRSRARPGPLAPTIAAVERNGLPGSGRGHRSMNPDCVIGQRGCSLSPVGSHRVAALDVVLGELLAGGDRRVAVGLEHETTDGDAGSGHWGCARMEG